MSYDIRLKEPITGKTIELENEHAINGGVRCIGETKEAWLNITYNYSRYYYAVFGDKGIRQIYGMTGAESIPVLKKAIAQLKNDINSDYWKATEGNAKMALYGLLSFAQIRPDGIWNGD